MEIKKGNLKFFKVKKNLKILTNTFKEMKLKIKMKKK